MFDTPLFSASTIIWILFGYLLGSCPTGYLLVKFFTGEDIRTIGSGNIGATNVSRVLGRKWGIITAIIDMSKGGVAVLFAMLLSVDAPAVLAAIGVASVIGHDYPVWIGFKGGKGVATTFGVFACFDFFNPLAAIAGGICWIAARQITRYVSFSSMLAVFVATLAMPVFRMDSSYYVAGLLLSALTVWRHRENIARLVAGTERKIS